MACPNAPAGPWFATRAVHPAAASMLIGSSRRQSRLTSEWWGTPAGREDGRGTPAAPATLTAVERPETPAEAAISDRGGPRRKEVASRERNKIGDLLVRQPSITLQRVEWDVIR